MTLFPLEERTLARSRGLDVALSDKKVAIVDERLGGRQWKQLCRRVGGGEEAKVGDGTPVSIYVNYPGERKSHDRPGASSGKVGKLASSRAKRCWPLGIKAVINYAITRCYLKIKTVFFASMRLTDSHIALPCNLSFLSRLFFSFAFSPFLFLVLFFSVLYLSRLILHSCQFSNGESYGFYCKGCASSLFADSSCFSLLQSSPVFSVFSLSCGISAGLFVAPVFSGIPDLELIFVDRKLCRSHS